MKITLTLDDAEEFRGQIKEAIQNTVRNITRDELRAMVIEEVSKDPQRNIQAALNNIPNITKDLIKSHFATLIPPRQGDGDKMIKKEIQELLSLAFPKDYLELIMTGLMEATFTQIANDRLTRLEKDEAEQLLREYKNTFRQKLQEFVNRV